MADFVKLNGYDVKDATSRASIANIEATLNGIKRPEDFGCVGNGIVDDTANFQSALDGGGYILGTPGKNYRITESLAVSSDTVLDLNHATITADNLSRIFYNFTQDDVGVLGYNGRGNITIKNGTIVGGCISFIHGHNILVEDIHFLNVNNDHMMEICACNGYTVNRCIFEGLSNLYPSIREVINIDPCTHTSFPWLPEGSTTFDGTKNINLSFTNNTFKVSTNANYGYMQRAIGCHAYEGVRHTNIIISGNTVLGNTDNECAFGLFDMSNVLVTDNLLRSKYGVIINGSDYVSVINNRSYCDDSVSRTFCIAETDSPSTHVSIYNNVLINRGGRAIGTLNKNVFTFDLLQPDYAAIANDSTVNTEIPVTDVNTMTLLIGSVGSVQFTTVKIKSFNSRGFEVNEQYPIMLRYGLAIVTITGDKQISITTTVQDGYTNCRAVILEKEIEYSD